MKEGQKYIDAWGQIWILDWREEYHDRGWWVWRSDTGWGLWQNGLGLVYTT